MLFPAGNPPQTASWPMHTQIEQFQHYFTHTQNFSRTTILHIIVALGVAKDLTLPIFISSNNDRVPSPFPFRHAQEHTKAVFSNPKQLPLLLQMSVWAS